MLIEKIKAKLIENSRKEQTIKVIAKTSHGAYEGSAPSGASTSSYEAIAFPKGVKHSVNFMNNIVNDNLKKLEISSFDDLQKIEEKTPIVDVGGDGLIALESVLLKALSKGNVWYFLNKEARQVPRPVGNCVGGGMHIKGKKASDFQEFLLLSLDAQSFSKASIINHELYGLVGKKLRSWDETFKGEITDEGAWAPNLSNTEILDVLSNVLEKVNARIDFHVCLGLDVAATSFFDGKKYCYKNYSSQIKEKKLSEDEQIEFLIGLVEKYNITYLEDPLEENDVNGFKLLKKKIGKRCLIIGDDVTATQEERLEKAKDALNALIIKPNQAGSYIRMKAVIEKAKKYKLNCIMSHRSGETMDDIIADLAVGFNCELLKCGIYGKEREAKLKRVNAIENEIKYLKKKD